MSIATSTALTRVSWTRRSLGNLEGARRQRPVCEQPEARARWAQAQKRRPQEASIINVDYSLVQTELPRCIRTRGARLPVAAEDAWRTPGSASALVFRAALRRWPCFWTSRDYLKLQKWGRRNIVCTASSASGALGVESFAGAERRATLNLTVLDTHLS